MLARKRMLNGPSVQAGVTVTVLILERRGISLKQTLKNTLKPAFHFAQRLIGDSVTIDRLQIDRESYSQQIQRNIVNQYKLFKLHKAAPYKKIGDAGFRVYSQFEEDGIILYVLSMIEFKTKRAVEMCCGSGEESMSTNLIF